MLDYERVKSLIISINIVLPQTIIQIVKGVSRRRLSNFGQVKMSLKPSCDCCFVLGLFLIKIWYHIQDYSNDLQNLYSRNFIYVKNRRRLNPVSTIKSVESILRAIDSPQCIKNIKQLVLKTCLTRLRTQGSQVGMPETQPK